MDGVHTNVREREDLSSTKIDSGLERWTPSLDYGMTSFSEIVRGRREGK